MYTSLLQLHMNAKKTGVQMIIIMLSFAITIIILYNSVSVASHTMPIALPIHESCQESAEQCLYMIRKKTGMQPKLISFVKQQPIYSIHQLTGQQLAVPNIVHFVRYGQKLRYDFQHYVSLISVAKFIKPHLLLIWGDYLPPNTSAWWRRTVKEVPNIYHVRAARIPTIYGKPVKFLAHEADWLRMRIITG